MRIAGISLRLRTLFARVTSEQESAGSNVAAPLPAFERLEPRALLSGAVAAVSHAVVPHAARASVVVRAATVLPTPVADSPGTVAEPGPTLDTTTPTFSWHLPDGADASAVTGYQVNIFDQTKNKGFTYRVTGATATTFTLPAGVLRAGDKAVWNVRVRSGDRSGAPSAYLRFRAPGAVTSPTLPAPVASGPGSATAPGPVLTTLTPTLTWAAVPASSGATGYQVNIVDQTRNKTYTFIVPGATATSFTVPAGALGSGDKVVWNVRARSGDRSGPPSTYLYFQTPPEVAIPTPVADAPGTTTEPGPVVSSLTPTFTWHLPDGADASAVTGYQLTLFNKTLNKTFTYTIVGATTTSFTLPAGVLANGNNAVWNVRARRGDRSGAPSAYLNFQAPAEVAIPVPVADAPGSTTEPGPVLTTLTPTFTWHLPDSANTSVVTGYQVTVFNKTLNKSFAYVITGAGTTSFTLPAGVLRKGDKAVWNVRAQNGSRAGAPSAYLHFQAPAAEVQLPAPTAKSPGSTAAPGAVIETVTPTFTWEPVSVGTGYQINVFDVTQNKAYTYTVTGAGTGSFTVPTSAPLPAGHKFVWNVRVMDGDRSGPPSTYLYFQTPPPVQQALPTPVADGPGTTTEPGPVVATLRPTLTWHLPDGVDATGVTGYQLNVYNKTLAKNFVYAVSGASTTSFNLPAGVLRSGDKVVWNVRARGTGDRTGSPSAYLNFQAPAEVAIPTPIADGPGTAAEPGPVLSTLTPTFQWHLPSSAPTSALTGFQLNVYDATQQKMYTYAVSGADATSFTLPAGVLHAGDRVVWNVRGVNGSRSGGPSAYLHFLV
jgi:hypothetical protein